MRRNSQPKFQKIKTVRDILNSEGPTLHLVRRMDSGSLENSLYIESTCSKKPRRVLCKTTPEILALYFEGRLRTKDLFIVRSDEKYYIKRGSDYSMSSYCIAFREDYIEDLTCGNLYYTELYGRFGVDIGPSEIQREIRLL